MRRQGQGAVPRRGRGQTICERSAAGTIGRRRAILCPVRQISQPGLLAKTVKAGRTTAHESDDMNAKIDRGQAPKWNHGGLRVIPGHALDANTPQTPGMDRKAAINYARVGAKKIWEGTVNIRPNAKTGAHHHGELESIIYVVSGKARMRWASGWNSPPKPVRAISSMCRRSYPIRKSTPARASRSNAWWCAATTKRSWSTSTSSRWRSPTRFYGSTRFIRGERFQPCAR